MQKWLSNLPHIFLPLFAPRKAREIRRVLITTLETRFSIIQSELKIDQLPLPKVRINFPMHGSYHMKGRIELSSNIIKKDFQRTIDHEISHYIQYTVNENLNKIKFMNTFKEMINPLPAIRWILFWDTKGLLTKQAFREGFATYVEALVNRTPNDNVRRAMNDIKKRKKRLKLIRKSGILPYAIGYLRFLEIETQFSKEIAIQIGLSGSYDQWRSI